MSKAINALKELRALARMGGPMRQAADLAIEEIDRLRNAVEAGVQAFEFLGERLNSNDSAADEHPDNLERIAAWADLLRAEVPQERQKALYQEVWEMLGHDAAADQERG